MNWNPMMGPLGGMSIPQQQNDPLAQLAQAFAGPANSLGQAGVTLGNQQAQDNYSELVSAMVAQNRAASDADAAAGLRDRGWIDNSGIAGVAEQVFNAYASKKLSKRADEAKVKADADFMREQDVYDQRKEQRAQDRADATTKRERERRSIIAQQLGLNNRDALAFIETGKIPDAPKADWRERRKADGSSEFIDLSGAGGGGGGGSYEPRPSSGNSPAADAGFAALRDAVEWQESRGNPNAVSPVGARGRMQTMPGTLRDPGYGITPARDNSDEEMTRVGNEYLQAMVGKYGTEGGLAAYNWGPGNWERALAQAGGDPRAALASAPKETRDYVPSVLGRVGSGGGAGMGWGTGQQPQQQGGPRVIAGSEVPTRQLEADERARITWQEAREARARQQANEQTRLYDSEARAADSAEMTMQLIEKALQHPGRETYTGLSGWLDPRNIIPSTDARNYEAIHKQLEGKAFMEAFANLKGGGQITEKEGEKATAAMARLSTAQSDEEYANALSELLGIARTGRDNARARMERYRPAQPQGSDDDDALVNKYL